jgi:hypothetical protein
MTIRKGLMLIWLSAGWLSADTIYSNLGPGDSYQSTPWSSGASGGDYLGINFVATGGGALADILVPLSSVGSAPASVDVGLYAGSPSLPGELIESWTPTLPGNFISSPGQTIPLVTLTSIGSPLLTAGQEYWFIVAPTADGVVWSVNSQGVAGGLWFGFSLGTLQSFMPDGAVAQAIDVESTPEPSSGTLFGLSCGLLFALYALRTRIHAAGIP